MRSITLSVSIELGSEKVYEYVSNPENLPQWVPFFQSVCKREGEWLVESPEGTTNIQFVAKNEFGVLDHYVSLSPGKVVYNPMRVIPNGSGSEVIFTLFQLPGMSDDQFSEDARLVDRDLSSLKAVLEGCP